MENPNKDARKALKFMHLIIISAIHNNGKYIKITGVKKLASVSMKLALNAAICFELLLNAANKIEIISK